MTRATCSRVFSTTACEPLSTRDTVATDTPALAATSLMEGTASGLVELSDAEDIDKM